MVCIGYRAAVTWEAAEGDVGNGALDSRWAGSDFLANSYCSVFVLDIISAKADLSFIPLIFRAALEPLDAARCQQITKGHAFSSLLCSTKYLRQGVLRPRL